MMKDLLPFIATVAGAILHHLLFWETGFGLNTLLFAVSMLSMVFLLHPGLSQSRPVMVLTGGVVLSAITVVLHHSVWSQMMYLVSFTLLLGVVQQRELRFLWYALCLGAVSWLLVPIRKITEAFVTRVRIIQWNSLFYWAKILVLPLLLFGLFLTVYSLANQHLAGILERIAASFEWLERLDWSPWQFLFFLFGWGMACSLFFPGVRGFYFARAENKWKLTLRRKRPGNRKHRSFSTLALRSEYWMGILVVGMLNGLLLLVNALDLRYVWIPPSDPDAQELSQFVHAGTSLLILAIVMAMVVLLVFFRRNLNFFPENDLLKKLAYLWIAQNGVLALSVAMRNIHYIDNYGLTNRRLGVLLFLFLVGIGLFTLFLKIRYPKTIYYLLRTNAWALYLTFLGVSMVNWDVEITRYNLRHPPKSGIDYSYLRYKLSDKNFFLLDQLPEAKSRTGELPNIKARLENRLRKQDWRAWNWADARNRRYLREH